MLCTGCAGRWVYRCTGVLVYRWTAVLAAVHFSWPLDVTQETLMTRLCHLDTAATCTSTNHQPTSVLLQLSWVKRGLLSSQVGSLLLTIRSINYIIQQIGSNTIDTVKCEMWSLKFDRREDPYRAPWNVWNMQDINDGFMVMLSCSLYEILEKSWVVSVSKNQVSIWPKVLSKRDNKKWTPVSWIVKS